MPFLLGSAPAKIFALHRVSLSQWSSTSKQNFVWTHLSTLFKESLKSTDEEYSYQSQTQVATESEKYHLIFWVCMRRRDLEWDVKTIHASTPQTLNLILVESDALANTYFHHGFSLILNWKYLSFCQVFQYFISRVRQKLHIVLCMSPVGEAFRSRCRMFPSLVNCCTIDWFVQVSDNTTYLFEKLDLLDFDFFY